MGERKFSFVEGEYFHIYNRGNSKQVIFKDRFDYERFQILLFVSNATLPFKLYHIEQPYKDFERGDQLVHIGAYCLMPNHFHILLTPAVKDGVSLFMQKLATGFSSYFNNKYDRTGGLFEGRFRAEWADSDEYLKYLFSYIHLNPVKLLQPKWKEEGIQNCLATLLYLENYRYSSFVDYDSYSEDSKVGNSRNIVERKEVKILNKQVFPEYFKNKEDFRKEILDWINFNPKTPTQI